MTFFAMPNNQAANFPTDAVVMNVDQYSRYKTFETSLNKRFSNRWQMAVSVTIQDNPSFFPDGTASFIDPTGLGNVVVIRAAAALRWSRS